MQTDGRKEGKTEKHKRTMYYSIVLQEIIETQNYCVTPEFVWLFSIEKEYKNKNMALQYNIGNTSEGQ